MSRLVLVDGAVELVDGWRHLQSHEHDFLRLLQSHILWPLDKACQVALGLDGTTEAEAAGRLLEERVFGGLLLRASSERCIWQLFLGASFSFGCHGVDKS